LRVLGVLDHALSITDQEGIPFTDAVNRVVTGEVSPERMSPGQAMSVARGLFQLDRRVFTTHEKKVAETFLDETVKQMGLQLCTLMTTQSAKPKE
jgi:hypothetical protein